MLKDLVFVLVKSKYDATDEDDVTWDDWFGRRQE